MTGYPAQKRRRLNRPLGEFAVRRPAQNWGRIDRLGENWGRTDPPVASALDKDPTSLPSPSLGF
eukprot:7429563-Pyramimonas_sp.AAC.1